MGSQLAFGQFLNATYKFDQADVVLSIDANFLANGPGGVRYARDFAAKRVVRGGKKTQSRFYAVESTPTSTGAKADHRLPVKASDIAPFVHNLSLIHIWLFGRTLRAVPAIGVKGSVCFRRTP